MKNPFVAMAAMAAAQAAAIREHILREFKLGPGWRNFSGASSARVPGRRNPAGAKLIRKFYRNKFRMRGTWKEAAAWHQERGLD